MRPIYDLSSVFAAQIHQSEAEAGKVFEPVIGIVTDNKDPNKLGRVKLKTSGKSKEQPPLSQELGEPCHRANEVSDPNT